MSGFFGWVEETVREVLTFIGGLVALLFIAVLVAVWWDGAPGSASRQVAVEKPDLSGQPVSVAVPRAFDDLVHELKSTGASNPRSGIEAEQVGAPTSGTVATPQQGRTPDATSARTAKVERAKQRLLTWARRSERMTFVRVCPPKDARAVADYQLASRVVRICPHLTGEAELVTLTHEVAHHLQGLRGRLGRPRNFMEDEADAVAVVALRAIGLYVEARE